MTRNTRNHAPIKESPEYSKNRRDESEERPSPDDDFPVDSPNPGGATQ